MRLAGISARKMEVQVLRAVSTNSLQYRNFEINEFSILQSLSPRIPSADTGSHCAAPLPTLFHQQFGTSLPVFAIDNSSPDDCSAHAWCSVLLLSTHHSMICLGFMFHAQKIYGTCGARRSAARKVTYGAVWGAHTYTVDAGMHAVELFYTSNTYEWLFGRAPRLTYIEPCACTPLQVHPLLYRAQTLT